MASMAGNSVRPVFTGQDESANRRPGSVSRLETIADARCLCPRWRLGGLDDYVRKRGRSRTVMALFDIEDRGGYARRCEIAIRQSSSVLQSPSRKARPGEGVPASVHGENRQR